MQLSVCIIAKNEERNIERCLRCLKPYDFEIIVVDTGSLDRTKEIAAEYTKKLYDYTWCDDFAAARNFAISKASNEFVMIIDSDEYLERLDVEQLYLQIQKNPHKVGRIRIRNVFTGNKSRQEHEEWVSRIFAKELFCYEGRIHEQVVSAGGQEYETYRTLVTILHSGYDLQEEERKAKANRNIVLLQKELEVLKEEKTSLRKEQIPYILYQLGKGYYMAGDYKKACDYFSQGLSYDLNPKLEYVIDMVETYGYALINSGQAENALFFENIYEEFGNSADFQFLMGLIYMNNSLFDKAVEEFKKAVKHAECKSKGVNSYAAFYNIGVIYECLGYKEDAKEYYLKCADYEPAEKRLAIMQGNIK